MVLEQILTILIIFLGLIAGIILARLSPEEMKTGKRYFKLISLFVLVFILFFLFSYLKLNIYLSVLISVLLFLTLLYVKINSLIFYILFPIIIYFSKENIYLFAIECSLMFIFGLATGSSLPKIKNKKFVEKKTILIILKHSIFLPLAILAILI